MLCTSIATKQQKMFTGGLVDEGVINIDEIKYPQWEINSPLSVLKITQNYHSKHRALDFAQTPDNDIYSVDSGTIIYSGWLGGYGYRVEILHENGFKTTYSHLSRYDVVVDEVVVAGQLIGKVGSTGNSTGGHLHFEIINDKNIKMNPFIYLFDE